MLYYLFVIGIINLVLGYALAVYLGYGPLSFFAAWHAMDAYPKPPVAPPPIVAPPKTAVIPAEIEFAPIVVPGVLPAPEAPPPPVAEIAEPLPAEPPVSHVAMLDDRADEEELFVQPAFEAYDDDAVEAIRCDQPDTWETNAKYVETSIQNLNVSMMKNGIRAIELDNRLRSCRGRTDAETIQQCLAQLKEDCQTYLSELEEAAKRFQGRVGASDKLNELGVANEMSNLGQAAQIETTLSNLENMDFRSDLEAANQRLMDELDHLRVARHAWRDHQESTFLRLARIENSVNKIEKQLQSDPTTGLPNRIGLEMALDAWWQEGRHQQQSLAAVLLNVDALGKLNRQQGALAGDSLLYQLGRHLRATAAADDLVGRAAGGSFLVVVPQSGRDAACKTAELLRHSIAQIRFKQGEETLQITVSAGVTEVRPEEPDRELMFARLAQSLKTAKQSGHNRSFFHDGTEPHLIETPPPAVESLEIAL